MKIITAINDFKKKITYGFYDRKTGIGRDGKYITEVTNRFNNLFWICARFDIDGICMKVCEVMSIVKDDPRFYEVLINEMTEEAKERDLTMIQAKLKPDSKVRVLIFDSFIKHDFTVIEIGDDYFIVRKNL